MSIRNRILVILAAVMVFALLVAGLSLNAFTEDNNAFKLTKADGTETIYQKSTGFATIIAGAPANSTITLLANADVEAGVDVPNSVTVDLNGFTVTTSNRLTPKSTAHVIFKNGTIDITKTELIYMNEWGSADATFELNNVTVKKGADAANKTLADMRVGTIIFDGITINEGVTKVPATATDIGSAKNAVSGAMLSLDSSVQFVFTLNASYTGPLTLSYAGNTSTCEVVGGKVGENNYITVDMRAFNLYDEVVTITAGEYSGTYDLAAYVSGVSGKNGTDEKLDALLLTLYNYCKEADEYNAYYKANGELN